MSSAQVPNNSNLNVPGSVAINANSLNINPSAATLLINQNQLATNIQLPSSLVNSTNVPTNSTTYILNPSTAGVQNLQPAAQIINTSQINQMIATSPLISQQSTVNTPTAPFQIKSDGSDGRHIQLVTTSSNGFGNVTQTPQMLQQPAPPPLQPIAPPTESIVNGNDESKVDVTNNVTNNIESTNEQVDKKPTLRPVVILDKQRLQELVQEVDPNEQLEEEVEDVLLTIADDFIESLVTSSCMIARHRKSNTLDVNDVQLALEKNWNMWIPGFGVDGVVGVFSGTATGPSTGNSIATNRAPKKCLATEAHKQRLALIRKTLKKF